MSILRKKSFLTLACALFLCFIGLCGQAHATAGGALNFTAASKAIIANNPLPAGTGYFTIAFWINKPSQTYATIDYLAVGTYGGSVSDALYISTMYDYDHKLSYFCQGDWQHPSGGGGNIAIDDGNWHFIVYEQASGGYTKIWVDAQPITSIGVSCVINFPSAAWAEKMFGNRAGGTSNSKMDEVGFWTGVLLQEDIDYYYNSGIGRPYDLADAGILEIYHLDEGSGNTAVDSKSGNNATITDPAWVEGIVPAAPPAVCDPTHCDLCEDEGVCSAQWSCYWYGGACHDEPSGVCAHNPPENCEQCLTISECWHMCGYYRWFDDGDPGEGMACHENPDPASTCEWTDNWVYGQDTRVWCLKFTDTYWDCDGETGVGCCKELANCSYGDVLIIGDWTTTTSTPINFNYTDYTTDWTTSTPLFAPIFNILPTIANPLLETLGSVANIFGDQQAEALAASFSGGILVIGGFANSFNEIFYGIPIFEGVSLIIAIMILKTIFELIVKIRALLKIT